jgi:hypothetical protein
MSWPEDSQLPRGRIARWTVYGICAVVFGLFALFNLVWLIATIQAFLSIVSG